MTQRKLFNAKPTIRQGADYTALTFAGKQYDTLDDVVNAAARSYARKDFKTALLLTESLDIEIDTSALFEQLIEVKKILIYDAISHKIINNQLIAS